MKHEDWGSFSPAHQDRVRCSSCGSFVEPCDGADCDVCGSFTCHNCGTYINREVGKIPAKALWLCESCLEADQLEAEMTDEEFHERIHGVQT